MKTLLDKEAMTTGSIVRYWHPERGGWRHATLLSTDGGWSTIRDLAAPHYEHRVPTDDVKPGAWDTKFENPRRVA